MDLNSYIQLKEAYSQVGKPQQLTESVDSIWEEVEAFAHALVEEEGLDLSDMTWDEVREAYLVEVEKGLFGLERMGGQIKRAGAKMFGNAKQRNDAVSWEKSKNDIDKRRGQNAQSSTATQGEIDAETAGRRRADPKYKPGQGVGSGQPLSANKPAAKTKTKPETKTTTQTSTQKVTPKPAAPAKDRMAGASKADRMGAWAKANPKLAAAQKQRAATKGTSATTNPMMKDLAKRMPKPAAPNKPSGGGLSAVKPQSFKSSVAAGSAMKSAASKPAPKPAASKPAAPSFGTGIKAGSMLKKEEFSDFDIILTHLIEQGFGDDEALTLMVNMTEEKRVEILSMMSEDITSEKGKAKMKKMIDARTTDSGRAKSGKGQNVKDIQHIGRANVDGLGGTPPNRKTAKNPVKSRHYGGTGNKAERRVEKMKTQKEETDSLYQAYLSMMSGGEQLDELSKKTMGSYVKKAAKDVEKRSYDQAELEANTWQSIPEKDPKIDKRQKGIGRAVGKMTRKEETDSLYQAYLSMMSEEEYDTRKDKHQERGGHAARTDYSKPPSTGNTFGKKKPLSDEERSAAMAKIVAKLKKKGGK